MDDESQTMLSFEKKWKSSNEYQASGAASFDSDTLNWIVTRNGFEDLDQLSAHLKQFSVILDAGCGNGRILRLFSDVTYPTQTLHGLDYASAGVARDNLGSRAASVIDADLMDLAQLRQIQKPDFIYCQEVLHHTANPKMAFKNLAEILNFGGEIAIYVYKKKAPVREFTDDYVRNIVQSMSHSEAMDLTNDFAQFGKALAELNIQIQVPAVRLLDIPAGTHDLQRLFYNFFLKCYWNSELSPQDNNMINFDWYHPSRCSRHTIGEVRGWFEDNNLNVIHECEDEYGITLRGTKPNL